MTIPPLARRAGTMLLVAAVLVGLAAAPAYPDPPDAPAGALPVGGGAPTATVTLITGDRVAVSGDPDGATSVTVLPAADGRVTPYLSRTSGGDRYLIPTSAIPALAAEQLDPELFNVTGLVRQGYDDAHTDALPLIAEYAGAAVTAASARAAPAGTEPAAVLDSIDSVALRADKDSTAALWRDLQRRFAGGHRATAGGTLQTVWLDRPVTTTLDRSTRQVGAPVAWAAGYDGTGTRVAVLDTGVDAAHPDLAGQVVASENFTFDGPDDGNGHGTHTASTVAGTGAASDGAKRGVAPGADLLIGKVLDDNGRGFTSAVIAGMEWAVGQAADVVSMSLGGEDFGGCADPLAQAAERLSGQALFVVSAGNEGPGRHTVGTPGCTPGVLTVAAVDRQDATADFSSRGFVPQTHTLKPDLAAPGVGISAAAAGGRGAHAYLTASGTSMAAPHVSGAAAILHQARPGATPQQLKAALLSAAQAGGVGGVHEVGAGRLDVGAAVGAAVTGPGVLDAGSFPWPQAADARRQVGVPYTNTSGQPVTLRLAVEDLRGNDGQPAPGELVSLAGPALTVPAGGTATASLTVHPGRELPLAQYGELGGRLVATAADGSTVSTAFSFYLEPESVDLTLRVIGRDGETPDTSAMHLASVDTGQTQFGFLSGQDGTRTFRLRAGPTFIGAFLSDYDAGGTRDGMVDAVTFLSFPERLLTEDTTLVLDARRAQPVTVVGDRPLADHSSYLGFGRWSDQWLLSAGIIDPGHIRHHYAWSDGEPAKGEFEFHTLWRLGAPRLELRTTGADALDIPAMYTSFFSVNDRAMFRGHGMAELADAGTGTPAELAAAGAAGKVVLVENGTTWQTDQVAEAAHAAGAAGVLLHRPVPGRWSPGSSNLLPLASIEAATVAELRRRLAAATDQDPVTLRWAGQPHTPFQYNLVFAEPDRVPADLRYRVDQQQLARVDATWHSIGQIPQTTDWLNYLTPWNPEDYLPLGLPIKVAVPGSRVEYYSPAVGRWRHSTSSAPNLGVPMNAFHTYRPGEKLTEDWFRAVLRPAAGRVFETGELLTVAARRDNAMGFDFRDGYWADSEPSHWSPNRLPQGRIELFRDGESLGAAGTWAVGYQVPPEPADYELLLVNAPSSGPNWQRSTLVETRFRFRSQRPTEQVALPIMFPGYQLPLDPDNTALARLVPVRLSASGHAGYTPEAISAATLAYSFDGGQSWTDAPVRPRAADEWTAVVDHRGRSGQSVSLRLELTAPDGVSVTQTVREAYTVR